MATLLAQEKYVVLANSDHEYAIVVQELGFICMPNVYFSRTSYGRNWGVIGGNFTLWQQPCLFILPYPTCVLQQPNMDVLYLLLLLQFRVLLGKCLIVCCEFFDSTICSSLLILQVMKLQDRNNLNTYINIPQKE